MKMKLLICVLHIRYWIKNLSGIDLTTHSNHEMMTHQLFSGIIVKVINQKDKFYFIKRKSNNKLYKYLIYSKRILNSWNIDYYVNISQEEIEKIEFDGYLAFRDGSVIRNISDSKIYVISNGKKQKITNPDILSYLPSPLLASEFETNLHEDGEDLT